MLKALQYLAAILVVACGIWIFGTSSSFKACKAEQSAAKAEQRKENPPLFAFVIADDAAIRGRCTAHVLYEYREFATAVATVFIALFTFTLWWSTKGMMKATKESVDLARQEFVSTHRPRIIVYGLAFGGRFSENKPIPISFRYVNAGDSDAQVTGFGSHIFSLSETMMPAEIRFTHQEISPPIDCPSGKHGTRLTPDTIHPDIVIAADVMDDPEKIVCVGYVLYRDGNGTRRQTGFCRQFDLSAGRWIKMQDDEYEYSY
jgi:hypothetical protein